jgi:enediyne biosynthesis protein E4
VTRPQDRKCDLPELGKVDTESGEFWVSNPFELPANKHNLSAYERNCVYLNVDGKSFLDASFTSTIDLDSDSRSAIVADFNHDGANDLLVASVGGGPLRLFENASSEGAHWVRINLTGTKSNRAAIGSRVTVRMGETAITRDLFSTNAFMGQSPAELTIGIGDAEKIDSLEVRWPTGEIQEFGTLEVDRVINITESEALVE